MEQIKPLREMEPKEKIQYIWDYYKLPILGVLLGVLIAGGLIHYYATYRDPALELLMVNVSQSSDTVPVDTFSEFLDANGFDSAKDTVEINSTLRMDVQSESDYEDKITFQAWMSGQTYSGFFSDETVFSFYSPAGYFRDLSTLLSEEKLAALSDRLIYADLEDGTAPYPCAVWLDSDNCPWLAEYGYNDCYFGILYGDTGDELAAALVRYIVFGEI
jgi:hypothetical protein